MKTFIELTCLYENFYYLDIILSNKFYLILCENFYRIDLHNTKKLRNFASEMREKPFPPLHKI